MSNGADERRRERLAELLKLQAYSNDESMGRSEEPESVDELERYDQFVDSGDPDCQEMVRFSGWIERTKRQGHYAFEAPRLGKPETRVRIRREDEGELTLLNFSAYHYLGWGHDPRVIAAAQQALADFGLGAANSPIIAGTLELHERLCQQLVEFLDMPDHGVALFASGYAVSLGCIPAYVGREGYVLLDEASHMSMVEGARLSNSEVQYFRHNDLEHLESLLRRVSGRRRRVLVCTEGMYSHSGEFSPLREIVEISHRHGAAVLVDEAHSMLAAGPNGRGVAESEGVLEEVDLLVTTFSKAFGGVGGAVIARRDVAQYMRWFANSRVFSCGLPPAVTAGVTEAIRLSSTPEGQQRRQQLWENASFLRREIASRVDLCGSQSWMVPVLYGSDEKSVLVSDWFQRNGVDVGIMQFPATPRDQARLRVCVTSQHSPDQLETCAARIKEAADFFDFPHPSASQTERTIDQRNMQAE